MKKTFPKVIAAMAFFAPSFAFAEGGSLSALVPKIGDIVNQLIPILSSVVVLVFFYGLIKYVLSAGDDDASKKARGYMIRGILGMFVLVTIWGIIGFMQNTIGNTEGPTVVNLKMPDIITGVITTP
ncbi:MAG: hypothetical protein WC878_07860 [Candidatus Paceibacterota bacterium]|jgi:hypothetical protein